VKQALKKLRGLAFRTLHRGDRYSCAFCGKRAGRFLHEGVRAEVFEAHRVSGGGYKLNTRCPHCGSVDRSRLLRLFFERRTQVFQQPTRLLHISPNKQVAGLLASHGTVDQLCGSIEPEAYAEFGTIFLDIQDMSRLGDATFDVVVCCHVLEHVPDDRKAMREIRRVLKPGGFAVLQVPLALDLERTLEDPTATTRKQRKITFGQGSHIRLYGLDYLDRLREAGFRVTRDHPTGNGWVSEREMDEHRLDPIEDVIVAHRDG
jgi:SAM-dependent methyltransferase